VTKSALTDWRDRHEAQLRAVDYWIAMVRKSSTGLSGWG